PATLAKTTEVRTELADPSPWIAGDSTQLAQLVMNLAVNGSEALKGRPGTVTIRTVSIAVDDEWIASASFPGNVTPGTYAAISVSDTGEGMTRETVERVFDPFFSTKFVGRGLGLAAVLGIVRGHRGALRIETAVGQGTVITAIFPLVPAVAPPVVPARPAVVIPAPVVSTGPITALVIDDEEVVRSLATRILERAGYRVLQADGGYDGLYLLERHRGEIGVVLLDLSMPDLSGREVLARMRETDPDLPVVLSSGLDAGSVESEVVEGHPVRFLQKPYRLAELVEVVAAAAASAKPALAPKGP
ncbi:MAG: response regulator, partial [Gemmatimonadales bacterium]